MRKPPGTNGLASGRRPLRALRRTGWAIALIALVGGCGSGGGSPADEESPTTSAAEPTSTSAAGTATSAPTGPSNASGPRLLPPTFVELEIDDFPRPAAEACAENETVTHVEAGASVADAVRDAETGTTVEVEPGSYSDDNDGDFRVRVFEAPGVCLRAAGGGEVVISPSAEQNIGIAIRADDVVIEGFTMEGFEVGVGFDNEEGQTIDDVTLERVKVRSPAGDYREGVISFGYNRDMDVPALDGLLLLDVTVEGTDQGISCNAGPCEHWWLENVSVTGRHQSEGSGADAFAIEEGRQIAVVSSSFAGAAADGIDTKAEDVVVYRTRVSDIGRNGVKLWKGGDVINTILDGTGADGALVGEEPARYRYLHVIVAHHGVGESGYVGGWGYDSGEPVELEIVNSIFFENATGGLYVPEGSTVSIRNTIFDDPDSKLLDVGGSTYLVSDLADVESLGWASSVSVTDPGFTDGAGGDFTTVPDSAARDGAEVIEGLEIDIAGQPRFVGRAPDVGPYEAQS